MPNTNENMGSVLDVKVFDHKLKFLQADALAFKTCWIFSSWISSFNKYRQTGFKNMAEFLLV